ncbi:EpsG family protein [Macrococcoides caseolyticum]|uniref:EpsG family protein n=1 Tax=Macrococcoides caseolyticum TaxID=69966 RepID=UPI0039C8EE09
MLKDLFLILFKIKGDLMFYTFTYILFSFMFVLFVFLSSRFLKEQTLKSNFFKFLLSIILSLYSTYYSTRFVLPDTLNYDWSFHYRFPPIYNSFQKIVESKNEIGFVYLNKLIYILNGDTIHLFFIIALIFNFITISIIFKYTKNYILTLTLFFFSQYYFFSFFSLKQALAISFGILAISNFVEKRYLIYFFYTLIAILFHSTAIILTILFFILLFNYKRKKITPLLIISLISLLFFKPLLNILIEIFPIINIYLLEDPTSIEEFSNNLSTLFKGIPFYIITIYSLIYKDNIIRLGEFYYIFILCSLFCSVSWLFSINFYWLFRLNWYFAIFTILLVPVIIKVIKTEEEKIIAIFLIYTPFFLITIRQIFISSTYNI